MKRCGPLKTKAFYWSVLILVLALGFILSLWQSRPRLRCVIDRIFRLFIFFTVNTVKMYIIEYLSFSNEQRSNSRNLAQ